MRLLIFLFILFCLFPYLDVLDLGTDTQPNAMILAGVLLLAMKSSKINLPIALLWILFILSFFLIPFSESSTFDFIRNSINYLAPALIALAAYNLFIKTGYRLRYSHFMIVVIIYMAVGLMQMFYDPYFLTFTVNDQVRGILASGRGVVSLCPEPAFYGSMCIFFMVFSFINYNKRQNLIAISLLLFQLVFLSRSATAIAIFLAALAIFFIIQLLRFRFKFVVAFIAISLIVFPLLSDMKDRMEESRAGRIYSEFIENPLMITKVDGSAGIRFTGVVAPFLALRHNRLLPMGIGHYQEFLREIYIQGNYRSFLTPLIINEKTILGGSANMVIYQMGMVGLLFPLAVFLFFRSAIKRNDKFLFAFILFLSLLFTQIQLMHSMTGLIMATALFFGKFSNK